MKASVVANRGWDGRIKHKTRWGKNQRRPGSGRRGSRRPLSPTERKLPLWRIGVGMRESSIDPGGGGIRGGPGRAAVAPRRRRARQNESKLAARRSLLVADGKWNDPCQRKKLVGRGRGVGREKQAYPPPGLAVVGKTDGECRVYGRGTPRRKNEASMVADGEWDARNKHIPRLARPRKEKPTGSVVSTKGVLPAERTKQAWSRTGSGTRETSIFPARPGRGWKSKLIPR